MKQRLLAYLLVVTVTASAIVGALAVSLHGANASAGSDLYLDDLAMELVELVPPGNISDVYSFFSYIDDYTDEAAYPRYWISVVNKGNNYCITLWRYKNNVPVGLKGYSYESYGVNYSGTSYTVSGPGTTYFEFVQVANLYFVYDSSYFIVNYTSTTLGAFLTGSRTWSASFGTGGQYRAFPNAYDISDPDTLVYCNKDLDVAISGNGFTFTKNLYPGSGGPVYFDFDLIVFWIGTRRYLSIVDQSLIRGLYGSGTYDYVFEVTYQDPDLSELTATYRYEDLVLIQFPGDIGYELENVSPVGVYAIDITGHTEPVISSALLYDDYVVPEFLVGIGNNVPYVLQEEAPEPGTEGTPDGYTQAWSVYNEYVSNYNNTSVVPPDLSDRIFSTSGAKTLPAEILIPDSLVATSGTAVVNPVFLWSFGSQVDGDISVIDYSLCDVCILPYNQTSYAMKFWYGSGVSQQFSSIDTFEFDRILDMYDVILIVNSYPDFLFDSGVPGPASIYSRGFTGTSSDMQYVDAIEIGTLGDQRFNCFAIITERCLQKTQLYNFSDGISTLYQLMVDYVDSEDKWKDSFLLWSSSVYYAINNLDGKLDQIKQAIVNLNQDLNTKLDTLINNTSPDIPEGDVWYTALWNWIMQFKPTNENFSNSLQVYDDNWDQIPQISAAPSVPLIPTIGG